MPIGNVGEGFLPSVMVTNKEMALLKVISTVFLGATPYIHHIKDVTTDGHCGVRVIARLMGFGKDEWRQVQKDLLSELLAHLDYYKKLYRAQLRADELIPILSFFRGLPPL